MHSPLPLAMLALAFAACSGATPQAPTAEAVTEEPDPFPRRTKTVLSEKYHVDARYASMRGPWGRLEVTLLETENFWQRSAPISIQTIMLIK